MLPASARLRKSSEISETMRLGKKFSSRFVVLHVRSRDLELVDANDQENTHVRVAFSVGKSVGNSVVRHHITRRLRHIMIAELPKFASGTDVVVRALPKSNSASFAELQENIAFVVSKALAS